MTAGKFTKQNMDETIQRLAQHGTEFPLDQYLYSNLPVKMFEVRDRMTMIPVIAIAMTSGEKSENFLLRRAGYDAQQLNVLLVFLSKGKAEYDPWSWGDRTLRTAHLHILDHWEELKTGAVIDVEFILGESAEVKTSERER